MNEEEARRLNWRSTSDQFQSASQMFAIDLVQRRKAFLEAGMPPHLVDTLLRDLHWLYTCKGLWPDTPPYWSGRETP